MKRMVKNCLIITNFPIPTSDCHGYQIACLCGKECPKFNEAYELGVRDDECAIFDEIIEEIKLKKMTNEEKAKEITKRCCEYYDGLKEAESTSYNSAMEMARYKDKQPISELGGWHTEPPTEDGRYLAETFRIPYKNCHYVVAEYDTNAQAWYDEAYENEIEIKRWKRI